mmetsp:Transcript_11100/g.34422  ORF Transcript_11100/g.34422 Transcript_11100/m.34422 type:complete len:359 (-) Transcript_11100:73-1149(-)|eukprot:CAMPEP_0174856482 /NCGR_PEP_ID=MMETSP1114-20130205/36021_1 /TAXON_ID=312471 /ORGANISM="Neobodo designis, Strain CCAP 1951/1" /LENGTH=358 /DNA_ID=CAMNT_0016091279 /DNA_START=89 /DNA_END=1165 /DNA_ORIENTATION=+
MHRCALSRRAARLAIGSLCLPRTPVTAIAATPSRTFTNLFRSSAAAESESTAEAKKKPEEDPVATALKINVADLANGDDMPPMLQYNDQLVEAALTLLEFVNSRDGSDATTSKLSTTSDNGELAFGATVSRVDEQVEAVTGIIGMLFSSAFVSPYQQYLSVARLLDLPDVRRNANVVDASHAIYRVIMPASLARVVIFVDTSPTFAEATLDERDHLHGLVEAVLDHGGSDAGDAKRDPDEVLLNALRKIETDFPLLFNDAVFIAALQDMNSICLQARFSYLVNETCLAFDPDRTGRIKLQELRESLEKLMPKYAVERMMAGCEADDDGTVYYPQMAAILMRGDGPVAPEAAKPPQASA